MFETQCEEVTDAYLAEGENETHEIEVNRAKENILFRLGSTDESRPKLYGSGCNTAVPKLFEKKEVKHGLKYITLGHVVKNRVVECKYEISPAGVGSLSSDEELFLSVFQKLEPSDKDKWFDHVLETLANYEVGKAHKEKEKEEAEKEAKFKKKLKAAELRALLEAAEREEEEAQNAKVVSGKSTTSVEEKGLLKRIAGAVAGTAKDFAEANKAPKLGN
ncbi:hypothetical protein CYMTET_39579 [Cymbomonas tetramitiformis]|uniref:Uncharacterized protein n=1 Tax=Cymbomonas tetramitiformis TaxID=36881 RepID=A0AAE0EY20_9CHLO|nr:hypothetical protein CYMTET_45425 [Cymbomonas tetramitiformis]KAK3246691.1 hypothetical protein CYMTET_43782 [Cymbomonas tetramitiformis]KAK3251072.1 hypothetical protein CYMTET_39579 [Cymbomonas tetramitiformis]